jgi:hypothetical protein
VDDRGRRHRNPAVVLVSNNPYSLGPFTAFIERALHRLAAFPVREAS